MHYNFIMMVLLWLLSMCGFCVLQIFAQIPTPQDIGICGLVTSTNISLSSYYTMWSCNSSGMPTTNPCTWHNVSCQANDINSIDISSSYISGNLM